MTSGPGISEVTLQFKTVASGVDSSVQKFQFIVTPALNGDNLDPIEFAFPNYQNGIFKSITVVGLN